MAKDTSDSRTFTLTARARQFLRSGWGAGLLALLLLLVVYLLTLQRIISGGDAEYVYDAGEMQVALNLWGLPHAPAYPLFILLGAPLVALLKLAGVNPAAAASTVSLVWSMAALAVTYDLLRRRTCRPWLAAVWVLLLGLMESVWLHSVVAEVYSLYLLFVALILWLALADEDAIWTRRRWLLLAALLGLGIAHHRAVAFLIPGLVAYLWPHFWTRRSEMPPTLALGALLGLAGFLPYLYLPLYVRLGGIWYSGDPTTLGGLWRIISASDWNYIWQPPHSLADFLTHVILIGGVLVRQFTLPGLVIGAAALVSLFVVPNYPRRGAWLLALSSLAYVGLITMFPRIVLPEAFLLPVLLLVILAAAEALKRLLAVWPKAAWASAILPLVLVVFLVWRNGPRIAALTRDPSGVAYLEHFALLDAGPAGVDTYFFATPWGPNYLAMSYGLYVTGEVRAIEPVDHNADLEAILAGGDRLVTTPDMLYAFPRDWWLEKLGGSWHLRSAGPGFVEIDDAPMSGADLPSGRAVELENGIILAASDVEAQGDGRYVLSLYWQADNPPEVNYSVYVHLADGAGGQVLAQADSFAPVSGWYPVTDWQPGEVVRDDYLIAAPEGYRGPLVLRAGMYRQLDGGSFENFDALEVPLE